MAIFVNEAIERLRTDIARHAKNGSVRSHGQEVFEGKRVASICFSTVETLILQLKYRVAVDA